MLRSGRLAENGAEVELLRAAVALHLKPGFALYIYQWFSGI